MKLFIVLLFQKSFFFVFFSSPGQLFHRAFAGAAAQPQQTCSAWSVSALSRLSCLLSPGLTAAAAAAANAAIAEAMKVKKIKLEAMSGYHGNANHHDGENGDLGSSVGEDTFAEGKWMSQTHTMGY